MGLKGKNVLVTGGTGFYGSHLVKELLDIGCNIYVVDLVIHPKSYFLEQTLDRHVIFEYCDITDFDHINNVIVKNDINFIFHAAALATVNAAYNNPLGTIKYNVLGTTNILESARIFGKIEGILFTSTDKAYGKLSRVDESKPLSGDHPYEVSKSSADLIARSYHKTYGLPVVVTRFGNVYGEGDLNFSRIIPAIMQSIFKDETLELRSNGKYVRDFVYVGDVVDASLLLAKNIKKTQGDSFNISSMENISVLETIESVENILNVKIDYKILSTAINEIPIQSVNFNKIKSAYEWKPKNSFKTTIGKIYEWYRGYFDLRK